MKGVDYMLKIIKTKEKLRLCELELENHKIYLDAYRKTMQSMYKDGFLTGDQLREFSFRLNRLGCC